MDKGSSAPGALSAWSYEQLAPGVYLWSGPAGTVTLVTPDGVQDL